MNDHQRTAAQAKLIKSLLDDIWNMGHCPKIIVDAKHKDVIIPEHVRTSWGERLSLDLEASYPMEPSFDEDAFRVTLAFQGNVVRCVFPWSRIYMVIDRDLGRGAVIAENMPEGVEKSLLAAQKPAPGFSMSSRHSPLVQTEEPPAKKPNPFRVIPGGKKN